MVYVKINRLKSKITLWKIYAWLTAILFIFGIADELAHNPCTTSYLDSLFSIISLVGLWGFVFKKTFFNTAVWKTWFIFSIMWDMTFSIFFADWSFLNGSSATEIFTVACLTVLLSAPMYIALYLYGYRSISLWETNKQSNQSSEPT